MKVALINGSPKTGKNTSAFLLEQLKAKLGEDVQTLAFDIKKGQISELSGCDTLVIAFPLYVDSIPAHVTQFLLDTMEQFKEPFKVYAIANNGFYEGGQNHIALEVLKNWCDKAGYQWMQGIGVGAGGMLLGTQNIPFGKGPNTNIGRAYDTIVENIKAGQSGDNIFITPNFPKFAYKMMAEMGWRASAKKNGLKVGDIRRKMPIS